MSNHYCEKIKKMRHWLIDYSYQLSLKLKNTNSSGSGTECFIRKSDSYANGLDLETSIKFLTCPIQFYMIYTWEIYLGLELFEVI